MVTSANELPLPDVAGATLGKVAEALLVGVLANERNDLVHVLEGSRLGEQEGGSQEFAKGWNACIDAATAMIRQLPAPAGLPGLIARPDTRTQLEVLQAQVAAMEEDLSSLRRRVGHLEGNVVY